MAATKRKIVVVGGGVFGLTSALELRRRGWSVRVLSGGPIPDPLAASTDISKAVRMDYGSDGFYSELADRAIDGWQAWNASFGELVYHQTGFLLISPRPLDDAGFEGASLRRMTELGHPVERLDAAAIGRRFPAWAGAPYVDGYFNPRGGWCSSGRVIEILSRIARRAGVEIFEDAVSEIRVQQSRVTGARTVSGENHVSRDVLVAAGVWTPKLVEQLGSRLAVTGQPVVHFAPRDSGLFQASSFPVWAADIAQTGWYGFPVTGDGRLKLANHGPGRTVDPSDSHRVEPSEIDRFRAFLDESCPALAQAPIVETRLCHYCDTADGDFWIDRVGGIEGLVVAAGGSGHAFKFAPVLGEIVADVIEGRPNAAARRFASRGSEAARAEDARRRR